LRKGDSPVKSRLLKSKFVFDVDVDVNVNPPNANPNHTPHAANPMPHPATGVQQKGWTVVDCGIDNPATCDAWLQVEQQTLQGLPILRVLVTHKHPDHMGLAHGLCERWRAPLWMSTSEFQSALLGSSGLSNWGGRPRWRFSRRMAGAKMKTWPLAR
jgi:glyoxylase-like metal-dependent hydrolase (beta-lactamase superfamily II)